jgi:hypothetical protein
VEDTIDSPDTAPPSLDLSFDWARDVLEAQLEDADVLTGRATTIFSIATAIVGFAIPLALSLSHSHGALFPYGVIALIAYGIMTALTLFVLWPTEFTTLKNPTTLREWYWDMQPTDFKMQILRHMEDAFDENQRNLERRGFALQIIVLMTALEVLFVTLFLRVAF